MICGYSIFWVIRCEILHGLFALLWCLPSFVALSLMLTTQFRSTWESLMEDSYTRILTWLGIFSLVAGLSFLSHVSADTCGLGF